MASSVLLMVGTSKGIFFLKSDASRSEWKLEGPHLPGWEVYSLLGLPGSGGKPHRILAGTSHYAYGATIRASDDFGQTWQQFEDRPTYPPEKGWKLNRIWQLEAAHASDPDTVFAGVDEAGLFVSRDRGFTWSEVSSLTGQPSRPHWMAGGGGLCLHTILVDPTNKKRMWIAISAVGAFRTDDGGETWKNLNKTLSSVPTGSPDETTAYCVHKMVLDPTNSNTLYMQFHGGVFKSVDAGDNWKKIETGLPGNFGFPMVVTKNGSVFTVPLESEMTRFVKDGKLTAYRSTDGGASWQPASKGMPTEPNYVGVLRDAMTVDALDPAGVYFGTSMGEVFHSNDAGDSWRKLPGSFPRIHSIRTIVI